MSSGLEDFSLFDLFRMEAEEQVRVLQNELIQLEQGVATAATLEALMRAAHSVKGAARIVGLDTIVHLTHAMEDRFVAAQAGRALDSAEIDRMLTATDWLARLQAVPEAETQAWLDENTPAIEAFAATFQDTAAPEAIAPTQSAAEETVAEARPSRKKFLNLRRHRSYRTAARRPARRSRSNRFRMLRRTSSASTCRRSRRIRLAASATSASRPTGSTRSFR